MLDFDFHPSGPGAVPVVSSTTNEILGRLGNKTQVHPSCSVGSPQKGFQALQLRVWSLDNSKPRWTLWWDPWPPGLE